jgi:hypothetical protein
LFENYLHNNDDAGIFSFINIKSDYFNCSSWASKPNVN